MTDEDGALIVSDTASIEVVERPLEERLRPGTELHREVLTKLKLRRDRSRNAIEDRFDSWNRTREHLKMYMDLSRGAVRGDKSVDPNEKETPWGRSIVIPMSNAIAHALLVQLISIFASRDPQIPTRGRGPEDVARSKLMDAMLAYDGEQMGLYQVLYAGFFDTLTLGNGIWYDSWETHYGKLTRTLLGLLEEQLGGPMPPQMVSMFEQQLGSSLYTPIKTRGLQREFNRWAVVDPYNFYPDPRVPIWNVQAMEYVGHRFWASYLDLYEGREDAGGPYINVDKLKSAKGSVGSNDKSDAGFYQNTEMGGFEQKDKGYYECDHLQVRLIPRQWELGDSEDVERWVFTWADDDMIIRAHPCDYDHDQFTYAVAQSEHDYHATFSAGTIEQLDGLQRFMNWLFNSHVQNVARFLNDAFVYSPRWVEAEDIYNPGPARHIRLTSEAEEAILEGRANTSSLFHQLPVQDLTGPSHLNAVNMLQDFAQRSSGGSDPMQGMQLPTRRTATEVSTITAASSARVSILARLIDDMAIAPLARRAISNRISLTTESQYYRMVGELARELPGGHIWVSRDMIQGGFDYVPNSGIHSPDPARQAELFLQMLQVYGQNPTLQQPSMAGEIPDMHKIAREAFKLGGAKHLDAFFTHIPMQQMMPQMQVVPDEVAMQQAQAGNFAPM